MATTLVQGNPGIYSGSMETVPKFILNGQSWNAGQVLTEDTAGLLRACVTGEDAATGGIKFYALQDQADPGNSTTQIDVGVITADQTWEGNILTGTITATTGNFGINVTSNVMTIDPTDTTNPAVRLVRLGSDTSPIEYDPTDINAIVYFKFLTTVIEAVAV